MRKATILMVGTAMVALVSLVSCKDYGDDLAELGNRVEILETQVFNTSQMDSLIVKVNAIVSLIEGSDTITSVVKNDDGSFTINFKNQPPITLRDGKTGADGSGANIGLKQDVDGHYYWTLDGEFILDSSGNKIWAGGMTPRVRINAEGFWEIYNETTGEWENTGVKANGTPDTVITITDDGNGTVTIVINLGGEDMVFTFTYKL